MSIYVRGDATPFVLTGKSDEEGSRLYGYWLDEQEYPRHVTDQQITPRGKAKVRP